MNVNSLDLTALAAKIQGEADVQKDLIAGSAVIEPEVIPFQRENDPTARLSADDREHPTNQLAINVKTDNGETVDHHQYPVSSYAVGQLANRANIPTAFFRRNIEHKPDLAIAELNGWLPEGPDSHMLRTQGDILRAVLSQSYGRIDNLEVAYAVLTAISESGGKLQLVSSQSTPWKMHMRVIFAEFEAAVKVGDPVRGGFSLVNGQWGNGRCRLVPFIERLECLNGMTSEKIVNGMVLSMTHLGAKIEQEGLIDYSEATHRKRADYVASTMGDYIAKFQEPGWFKTAVERLQGAANSSTVQNPTATVEVLSRAWGLSEGEKGGLLEKFFVGDQNGKPADRTAWGLGNAVTWQANDHTSYDRAAELENYGGRIITLPTSAWEKLANAKMEDAEDKNFVGSLQKLTMLEKTAAVVE